MDKKKIFLAIPLPQFFADYLVNVARECDLPGKIAPKENLHITVHFLGPVPSNSIDKICYDLEQVVSRTPFFEMTFNGIKYKKGKNHMIWAVFEESEEYIRL